MISFFRHHLQGRFLRYIVYAVSLLVILPFPLTVFMRWFNVGDANWVVKVNRASAGYSEYIQREQEIERQITQLRTMLGDKAQDVLAAHGLVGDPKTIALNSLTMQSLMQDTAQTLGIHISSAYRQLYMIRQLPRNFLLPNGEINQAMVVRETRKPFEYFEYQQEQRIKEEVIVQLTDGALFLPEFVLRDYFIREYVNHKFLIAKFSLARFVEQEKKQAVTDKELQEFFASENRKNRRYLVPERRSGVAWTFNPDTYGITISDNQINRYYERNKATEFTSAPAKIQVRQVVIPFAAAQKDEVARKVQEYRQELVQKPELFTQKGKLIDFFARGTHDPQFEQEAFRLASDGAISPVFETKDGFTILQRVARKTPAYKPLESVRSQIIHKLRVEQFNYSFPHMIRRVVAQENKEQPLADFARERGAKQQPITNKVLEGSLLAQKLFATRLNGVTSFIDKDQGIVVFVNQIQKAYEPAFEQIKARVTADYYRVRAERTLKALLRKVDVVTSLAQFQQFVREQGAQVEQTGWVHAHDAEQIKKLKSQFGDTTDKFFAMSVPGSVAVHMGTDTGYAVCLEALAPFDEAEFQTRKSELAFAALRSQRMLLEQGFVASLCRNATIKVQEKLRT